MSALANRRQFLQTFAFSAAAALVGRPRLFSASADPHARHLLAIGDWGTDGSLVTQRAVAQAMASYASSQGIQPDALLLLGDNFYGNLTLGPHSPRWRSQFEEMYPRTSFPGPCYALLGNHDYRAEPAGKQDAQLAYAGLHPGTRWTMPNKWYRFDLPSIAPLVSFFVLDSNLQGSGKFSLSSDERAAQSEWLKKELSKPARAPFRVVLAHHPLYSNGVHGDSPLLIAQWEALLRQHGVHLYLCGHDHDLQHLEFSGHPTSFVISGGGGANVREAWMNSSDAKSQFGQSVHGFTHLEIRPQQLIVRHLGLEGRVLHSFSKSPAGALTLL